MIKASLRWLVAISCLTLACVAPAMAAASCTSGESSSREYITFCSEQAKLPATCDPFTFQMYLLKDPAEPSGSNDAGAYLCPVTDTWRRLEYAWTVQTPASMSISQNNYSVGNHEPTILRVSSSATVSITGFAAANWNSGGQLLVVNVGTNEIDITNQDGASTAANRVITQDGRTVALFADDWVHLEYDGTTARWRVIVSSITPTVNRTFSAATCYGATAGPGWSVPISAGPVAACYGTAPQRFGTLDFADGTDATSNLSFTLPGSATIAFQEFTFFWFSGSTSTNSVVWTLATVCIGDGEDLIAPTYNTTQNTADANKATANQLNTVNLVLPTFTGCVAGETLFMKIGRLPSNGSDTLAATASLLKVEAKFTVRQQK